MEKLKGVLTQFSNPNSIRILSVIVFLIIVALPFGAPDATGGP
jgi:hypothetical protein